MFTSAVRQRLLSHWRHRVIVLAVALLALGAVTFTAAKPEAASAQAFYPGYTYNPACYSYNFAFYSYPWSLYCPLNYGYSGYNPYWYNPYYYNPYSFYGFNRYYPWYPYNWWQWRR